MLGVGGVTKRGGGALTMSANTSYAGTTKVEAGTHIYWKQNYGAPGSGSGGLSAQVPEPTALLLATLAAAGIAVGRRRRSALA